MDSDGQHGGDGQRDRRQSELLIVGLGNPGQDYARTRHNLGAMVVSELAGRLGVQVDRRRWSSLVARAPWPAACDDSDAAAAPGAVAGGLWLILPQTFMNESGRAVRAAIRDTGAQAGDVWVVHDELDLPLCRLRIRRDGSSAGHNGLRSIIAAVGSDDFVRFRIGVGKPPSARQGARHVLAGFGRREAPLAERVVEATTDALECALTSGLEAAMAIYNRPGSLGCEEIS